MVHVHNYVSFGSALCNALPRNYKVEGSYDCLMWNELFGSWVTSVTVHCTSDVRK